MIPSMAGFEGKKFYLDLENSPQIAKQLTQSITRFGGEIKDFLDHRIKYIVTSRPKDQWPPKNADADDGSRQSAALKRTAFQSPINLNKSSSFSRGSLLLSNAMKRPAPVLPIPTDVLERGRFWNITILNAVDVLEFCRRHSSPPVVTDTAVTSVQIKRLKGPHIKVEDNRLQHRPIYKEFYEWPTINYDFHQLICPFVKRKSVQKPVEEPIESLEGLAIKRFTTNDTNCSNNDKVMANQSATNLKTPPKDMALVKRNLIKRRRTPAYCEICGTEYEELSEHLKSEVHETYTRNEDNYKELKGVIQSLHPFDETKTVSKAIHFDDRSDWNSDNSTDDDEEELPLSPFQSTPNMSTTIQLCGSKHKSHFLPIHDLIGNRSPEVDVEPEVSDRSDDRHSRDRSERSASVEVIPPSITSPNTPKMAFIYKNCSSDCLSDSKTHLMSEEL